MKRNSKYICIIIIVLLLVLLGIIIVASSGNKSKQQNTLFVKNSQQNEINEENLRKFISIEKGWTTEQGSYVVKIVNNNDSPVYIENLKIDFKDGNENVVKSNYVTQSLIYVQAKDVSYADITADNGSFIGYTSFDTSYELTENQSNMVFEGITTELSEKENKLVVKATNESKKQFKKLTCGVVYFKDSNVVYVDSASQNGKIPDGQVLEFIFEIPKNSAKKKIDYDRYEIAYIYGETGR